MESSKSVKNEEIVLLLGYKKESYGTSMESSIPYYQPLFGNKIMHSLEGIDHCVLIDASGYKNVEYNLNDINQVRAKAEDVTGVVLCKSLLQPKKLEQYHLKMKRKTK